MPLPAPPRGFQLARVEARIDHAPGLATFRLDARPDFLAGQFFNLALPDPTREGEWVQRAYSAASAPGAPLEIYVTEVPGGALTPRLFALSPGDAVARSAGPAGAFVLPRLPPARRLWMVATGTGLGPFLSMLREGALWGRFDEVIVAHGARLLGQLGYRDALLAMAADRPLRYVAAVTREPGAGIALEGRLPALLASGALEAAAGAPMDGDSHAMLCGNPGMIAAFAEAMEARGLQRHRRRAPGHYTVEKYW